MIAPAPHPDTVLYLASASPRRRQLLTDVGIRFHQFSPEVDESRRPGEAPAAFVERTAADKALAGCRQVARRRWPQRPVLGADTAVVVDDQVLGKPAGPDQARAMLASLSGRSHEVLTAIALSGGDRLLARTSCSRVTFKELSDREIAAYWATGEPGDKAGAYAVQGLGCGFVSDLQGSFTGVVGLPMFELRCLLQELGIDWL